MIALDVSALLAFLFREAGRERVGAEIETACLSAVNLSEGIGRFVRDGHDARTVLHRLTSTSIEIVPFTADDAALAASLVPVTRGHSASRSATAPASPWHSPEGFPRSLPTGRGPD